jgi:hypothetical protein
MITEDLQQTRSVVYLGTGQSQSEEKSVIMVNPN